MRRDESSWDFTDAWVLTALAVAPRPCSLTDLVSAADGINHAVLLEPEVNSALGKLSGSGLVQVPAGLEFHLTPAGTALVEHRHGDLFTQVDTVLTALGPIPVRHRDFALRAGAMQEAVDE